MSLARCFCHIEGAGGIQPSTIEHLISGDESQEDGLWNRFMFTRLPQTRIDAFSHTPHSLTEHLEILYRSLAGQESFRHYLSEESKPLWAEWHRWTEDKTFSESSWIARGTYAKIEGIAARNALIIHRTMAAVAGTIPDRQISASTMAIAIEWTKWELSQTLLEYQMLGLTDDPELSKILKFIDKFAGKDWVSAADVRAWWSVKPKPNVDELKKFMAKVVSLGHEIDNDEAIDSGKYRIQILGESSRSSRKIPEPQAQQGIGDRLLVVANSEREFGGSSLNNGLRTATTDSRNGSRSSQTLVNGHSSDLGSKTPTTDSHSVNHIHSNDISNSPTTSTTFSNKNIFKVGDRAKLGDEIFTIDKIEDDFIGGHTIDGSYVGGHLNSVRSVSGDESPPPTNGKIERVPLGNGMVEIVRQKPTETIDDGEIEYEC